MFIGSLTTFSMVCHLMRRRSSTINNLILLEQAVNSANLPVLCITLARVTFPEWSKDFISHYPICISAQWLVVLALLNRSFGSLGIAIFRVLYVKAQSTILNWGETFLLMIIAGTGFTLIVVLTTWHMLENYFLWDPKLMIMWNFCMNTTPKIYMQHAYIDQVGLVLGLVANLIEFTCYFVLFSHLHGYWKMARLSFITNTTYFFFLAIMWIQQSMFWRLVSSRAGSRRTQSQPWVISLPWLFRQACLVHWYLSIASTRRTAEWLFGKSLNVFHKYIICPTIWNNLISRFSVHCIPSLNFALFPLVETLSSDELRKNLLATLGMRPRQRLPTPCGQLGICPDIYNINDGSKHIFSIADHQLRHKQRRREELERPKQSSATESLLIETHF